MIAELLWPSAVCRSTLCWAGFGFCHCCPDFVLHWGSDLTKSRVALCVPHSMFDSFIQVLSLLSKLSFFSASVALSLLEGSPSLGCQRSRVCGLGGLIPQECGIKSRPRLECCSQSTRAWLDVGVCPGAVWMSPDLLRARWCLLFSPCWHIFVPFLFPPCMNQQAQELSFPPAACSPKFPSFLPCWAAELRSPGVTGAATVINPVNPPSLGNYSNEIIANEPSYIYYLLLVLCHKLPLFPKPDLVQLTWFSLG